MQVLDVEARRWFRMKLDGTVESKTDDDDWAPANWPNSAARERVPR